MKKFISLVALVFVLSSFSLKTITNENLVSITMEEEMIGFDYCAQLADWYMSYYEISYDDSVGIFETCMDQ